MRIAVSAVLAAALAAGGAASLQVAGAQVGGSTAAVARTAYTVEPFTPAQPITVQGQGVRLRAEPFATKETQVLSSGSTGLQLTVVGIARQPDWDWYQVILKNGQKAFIRSDYTSAPSRGGAASASLPRPAQPPAQLPVYQPQTPTPIPGIPAAPAAVTPPAQPQPLPPIPTQPPASQPLNTGGAISLTPGAATPPRSAVPMTPGHAPVDNGLLSVSPTAPTPRFNEPASAPAPHVDPAAPADPAALPSTLSGLGAAEQIRAQLNINRCWTDSSSMMDAHRLRATFGVTFGPNGKFASEPRLITPAAEPANDPAMMVFVAKARAALRTCNAMGFSVPQSYYSGGQGELVLEFSAR